MGMREKYQSLALADLKEIAKSRGIKGTSGMKKADIKRFLALYFVARLYGEQMPDADGEQYFTPDADKAERLDRL